MNQTVEYRTEGPVAIIMLNRPDQRNCVNGDLANGLRAAVQRFEADSDLRVGVLAGKGRVFCAGMDLKAFADGEVADVLQGEGHFGGFVNLERTKPIIAAVQGAALAGGLEIMLACDMAIAEHSAKFGLPEARIGLIAGAGGVFRMVSRIPVVKAREYILTGAVFSAEEAERYGLLNRVVEDGSAFEAARALADEVAASAPLSVRDSLLLTRQAEQQTEKNLWKFNDELLEVILKTVDAQEGVRSFNEKRKPVWIGR